MSDLISREAAIGVLMEIIDRPNHAEFLYTDEICRALNKLSSANQWTPVRKGLPKAGVRYQVTFESGEVGYADFRNKIFLPDGTIQENVWECEQYYEEDGKVIAWMPLPEPYKYGVGALN